MTTISRILWAPASAHTLRCRAGTSAVLCAALGLLVGALGCSGREHASTPPQASTILLRSPVQLGTPDQHAVAFPHAAHTQALAQEGCRTCHGANPDGTMKVVVTNAAPAEDKDGFMNRVHALCLGCHEQQLKKSAKAGPVTCGGCHRDSVEPPTPSPAAMTWLLHSKHVGALNDECKQCHHVFDEKANQLRYEKGKEHACGSCHGAMDQGRNLSARHAAHTSCVGCHERRVAKHEKAGPTDCTGCHGWTPKPGEKALPLQHERPAAAWIASQGATFAAVAFQHEAHEAQAAFCTTCHHSKLDRCDSCHSPHGKKEGHGITLAQAYHDAASPRSCVGCHASHAAQPACKGCHGMLATDTQTSSCRVCHNGPSGGVPSKDTPVPAAQKVALQPLPAFGPDFPENIQLDSETSQYAPAQVPHGRIVTKLHEIASQSGLASVFHGRTEVLCTGCHHHTPVGQRPPSCGACHEKDAILGRDQPALKAAYHRQCVGCHERMQLKAVGCTDCHERKAVAEKSP